MIRKTLGLTAIAFALAANAASAATDYNLGTGGVPPQVNEDFHARGTGGVAPNAYDDYARGTGGVPPQAIAE